MKEKRKPLSLIMLLEMSDGKIYNVVLTESERKMFLCALSGFFKDGIKIFDEPIESIKLSNND